MDKSKILVSIIVATYNQKDTFSSVLYSLLNQKSDVQYEIIFADDGSDIENLYSYFKNIKEVEKSHDIDIKLIYQSDIGFRLSKSRNNALLVSNGNIIIMLDGDVIAESNLVHEHVKSHLGNPNSLVYTYRKHKNLSEISLLGDSKYPENINKSQSEVLVKSSMEDWRRVWGFNMSFYRPLERKQDFLFYEQFVNWGLEDAEFSYRLKYEYKYNIVGNENIFSYHIKPEIPRGSPYKTKYPKDLLNLVNNAILFIEKYNYDDKIVLTVLPTIPKYDTVTKTVIIDSNHNSKISTNKDLLIKDIYMLRELLTKDINCS